MLQKLRLSHSALDTFHTCERLFQLNRLLEGAPDKEDYPATVLGKAFGEGVTTYLLTQDVEKAIFNCWKAYWPILEDDKRTEEKAVFDLLSIIPLLDKLLLEWEVATFNFKPAIELSFYLEIDDSCYFVGYIDAVLRNKYTGRYGVLENKSTGLGILDITVPYRNSGQALGYSIALDAIAGEKNADYDVIYAIAQDKTKANSTWNVTPHVITFPKTIKDRLNWFITLQMDAARLRQMRELRIFPQRGSSCLQYMKPCFHFGTCGLTTLDREKIIPEDEVVYDFSFKLEDLVVDHLRRMEE